MQITSTTMYSKFNFLKNNRPVKRDLVNRLKASILYKNMLHLKPILVDQNMCIIDGQHRFTAAQELGVPIYYQMETKKEPVKIEELVCLQISGQWKLEDYLHAWMESGNKAYIMLQNMMNDLKIGLPQALMYLDARIGYRTGSRDFREGKLMIEDLDRVYDKINKVKKSIEFIKEKYMGNDNLKWTQSKMCHKSLSLLIDHPEFNYDDFMRKLPYHIQKIRPCNNYKEYMKMFLHIYNWRNKNPIKEDYAIETEPSE